MGRELKDSTGRAPTLKHRQDFIRNEPISSQGQLGDKAGDTIITKNYLYRCIQDFSNEDAWTILVSSNTSGYVTGSSIRSNTVPPIWALPDGIQPDSLNYLEGTWEIVGPGDFVTPAPLLYINSLGPKYVTSANVDSVAGTTLTVRRVTAPHIWRRIAWSGDTW